MEVMMNIRADLHCHSNASDGVLSPSQLVERAYKAGVTCLALTDHDTVAGLKEGKAAADNLNMTFIPGIELSCNHNNESIHILGYFKDDEYKNPHLISFLEDLKNNRIKRALEIVSKLKEHFQITINDEEVLNLTKGLVARPHIAKAIINSGYNYDFDYIFNNFIGNDSPAYVPNKHISIDEGITLLKHYGCIVSLAHPKLIKKTPIDEILSFPFHAIEAVYFQNTKKETKLYRAKAKEFNLAITSGSDFHGLSNNDTKHGNVGSVSLPPEDFNNFISLYTIK